MCARMLCLCGMVWVVGCHSATGEHAGVPGEQTTLTSTSPKTPEQPKQFMPGPTIRPSGPLLRWLNNTVPSVSGPRVRVRLPVIIRFYQPHQPHIGIAEAFIGTVDKVDSETVLLRLNDTPMGVSLFDRVRERCSKSETACAVWLEGYWTDFVGSAGLPQHFSFTVIRLHEFIEGTTGEEAVHAQSESPSP